MALQGIFQSSEIITEALQFGGNPALTTRAQNFLNYLLDHLYRSYDWEFLVTEASFSSASPIYTFTLPADYGRIKAIQITDTKSISPLVQVAYSELWQRLQVDALAAQTSATPPTYFAIEPGTPKAYVWPIPSAAFTGKMLYYKIPPKLAFGANEYPLFPDSYALVTAVTNFVEAYERETLQVILERESSTILNQYAAAHFDEGRSNSLSVKMDPAIFGGWNFRET